MSWPGYSSRGCSLSLHHLSWCPMPGIIGSGSTLEHATTPRAAVSTGTLPWNCTRKGYLKIWCTFLCLWITLCFPNLSNFFLRQKNLEACPVCCAEEWTFFSVLTVHLQCGVINKQQYVRWREHGLAFEMREGVYQITNPSLLSSKVFSQVSSCLFFYTVL